MPKVSFVIPIYNTEKYLNQCVDSLLCQTFNDFEIILVDDGSQDDSPQICDRYSEVDSRVKVIHKENGGQADARSIGTLQAQGDYIIFVDSDDFWLKEDCLEKIITHDNLCGLDFLGFNGSYYTGNIIRFTPYDTKIAPPISGNEAVIEMVKTGLFQVSACLKIVKRDFILDNQLFFVKGQTAEDIPWTINLLEKSKKCCFINEYVYAYRKGLSDSTSSIMDEKHFLSLFNIFKTEYEKVEERSFSNEAKNALRSFLAYEYCILLTYNVSKELRKELYSYKQILDYDQHPKVRKASRINKLFGIGVTAWVLKQYQKVRTARMK